MHEIMKIKTKEGQKGLTGLVREKPCKNFVENDKKSSVEPCQVREREEFEKSFEKVFESVKTLFLKNWIYDVRLTEKQV